MIRILFLFVITFLVTITSYSQIIPGVVAGGKRTIIIPKEPLDFQAEAISPTEVAISWTDNSNHETGYVIERSLTAGSGFTVLTTEAANTTSYNDTGLTPETVYYYRIKATGTNGDSEYSEEASAITPIAPPTNLVATPDGATEVDLAWDDNSGIETGYEIERSTTQGSGYALIHTTAANVETYSNTGLTANTTYYYRIRAVGGTLYSTYSNEDDATTTPALEVPTGLAATPVTSTQINLTWDDNNSNETGYEIERSTTSGSGFSLIHTTAADATSYNNTGLTAATTYYYRLRSINAAGNSSYTAEVSASTPAGTLPSAPTTLTATAGNTSNSLSWTDNASNETGFQIERSTDSNTSFSLIHTTSANVTSYNDTGLNEGRRYYYRVRATNGAGNSSYTNQANDLTTWSTPVTMVAQGTAASSTGTSISVPLPTSPTPTTGQMMVIAIATKTQQVRPLPPTNGTWAERRFILDNTNGNATDAGPITLTVFSKIATSNSEASPVVFPLINTQNVAYGISMVFSKDSDAFWSILVGAGAHNTVSTTSYSAISWEDMSPIKGDVLIPLSAINSNGITFNTQALAHSSASSTTSFSENVEEIFESGTSDGNDLNLTASMYTVSNNSTANGKATFTMTGSTSTGSAPVGVTAFIRLRNARTTSTSITQPPVRVYRAEDMVDVTAGADGSTFGDGLRVNSFGPDAGTTKYSIATFNGRPCVKFVVDFTTGINYRSELHTNPWMPNYPIGTQLIMEWKFETDANANALSPTDWLPFQLHPGLPSGLGPYSSNSPQLSLSFTYAGQTGFDNASGAATAGQLSFINFVDDPNIANTTGSPRQYIRNRYTGFDWAANSVYRIRIHFRADVITGDPVLKIWASKNGSAMTLLYEDYTYPTVYSTYEEGGVTPLVMGTPKFGVYHHGVKTESARLATIAAGHNGVTMYVPCMKQIILLPNDANYFTDYTNNSASIYDLVDTTDE